MLATVVLTDSAPAFDKPYSYALPREFENCALGCRCMVPFGRSNTQRCGFIIGVSVGNEEKLKSVSQILDKEPLLNAEGLYLVSLMHETLLAPWFSCVKCQIPPSQGIKRGGILKKVADKKAIMAALICEEPPKLTPRQREVFDLLTQMGAASVREIMYFLGVSQGVIKNMEKHGVIELYEEIIPPPYVPPKEFSPKEIVLSKSQQQTYDDILKEMGKYGTHLLFGVTGSGKTEVFIRLIEHTIESGKKALVLIPEISLTPQTALKFKESFGEKVAVLNSTLSMTERLQQYNLIKSGKCPIVVGTRLAVFSPLTDIGLIVIDEEQDSSYISGNAPRFSAKAIAAARAKYHGAPLLLCSATPSVESFYYAKIHKYGFFTLRERFSQNPLPTVFTEDLITAPMINDSSLITVRLAEEIQYNLKNKEQTVLLLNRRGYSVKLTCVSCRNVIKCPNCSVSMTYHSANHRLICHSCGYQQAEPKVCPNCGGNMMRFNGEGTQKAEEELSELFPESRILRMDADTTLRKNSHEKGFDAFKNGEYDIMIGTQMVSKGLNFPKVTLVGILNADLSLFSEDFRSFEKTFSLITQTIGRAGRGEKSGRAIIETFSPDNSVLNFCKTGDYEGFYREEIAFRENGLYPPFCNIVAVQFKSTEEKEAIEDCKSFLDFFSQKAETEYKNQPIRILGPAPALPYKRASSYYMQLLIKCRADKTFLQLLRQSSDNHYKQKKLSSLIIDMFKF